MRTRIAGHLPGRLQGIRRRLDLWRRRRKGRARIPETVWASAVKAAGKYGLARTARVLGLDYYGLKKRVETAGSRRTSGGKVSFHRISDRKSPSAGGQASATFLELDGKRSPWQVKSSLDGRTDAKVNHPAQSVPQASRRLLCAPKQIPKPRRTPQNRGSAIPS